MSQRNHTNAACTATNAVGIPTPAACTAGSATDRNDVSEALAVVKDYRAEDHRRRLQNIGHCRRRIHSCLRRHLVTNYLPGQCAYNLCEYPCRDLWQPSEVDELELDRLKSAGIQVIQVMDDWNDQMGLFGSHKLDAMNPQGFRRFVEMVHQRGMKLLAYASSGYFTRTDPHYRDSWARTGESFFSGYWNMAKCSPASPEWRSYVLPQMVRILDEYGVDGLYNDWGYTPNMWKRTSRPAEDEVVAFDETPECDGALADLLQLIYAEVSRRGGIVKFHCDATLAPFVGGAKVYDYLWVGEGVPSFDRIRNETKKHSPYVIPCTQFPYIQLANDDEPYIHAIPYLQFPLLEGGRPYTGERAVIPGVTYSPDRNPSTPIDDMTDWFRRNEAKWTYYQAHPNGPYVYGEWGPVPPSPTCRSAHERWLKRYRPLVESGTHTWLEVWDSELFAEPKPCDVVASVFANRDIYLVLANYGTLAQHVTTAEAYTDTDDPTQPPKTQWTVPPGTLQILQRNDV